jgi:peptidyl-prolyl cis-trans isomerase B (cyclophilin B)
LNKTSINKSMILTMVIFALSFALVACNTDQPIDSNESTNRNQEETQVTQKEPAENESTESSEKDQSDTSLTHPKVQIEMENGGVMIFELYPEYAPETTKNFINLASSGFYKGLTFHRIVKTFMVQGGDPSGNGTGGSAMTIKGEFQKNGFAQNTLKHTRGIISMARSSDPNSASSQFFIVTETASSLDGSYAAFGKLIEGDDVLSQIANTPVEKNPKTRELSLPKEKVVIKDIIVLD